MNVKGSGVDRTLRARRVWRVARWVLLALVVAYIALVIYRIPAVHEEKLSQAAVARIEAQKLTMDDVDGAHLPPPPDPAQVNATIAGVDANQNGIRDDVELAIFAKYPTSTAIRAAELQYAMALQMYLTDVLDSETWIAAATQEDRGYQCVAGLSSRDDIQEHLQETEVRTSEVEALVLNDQQRQETKTKSDSFTTSFGLPNEDFCDVSTTFQG